MMRFLRQPLFRLNLARILIGLVLLDNLFCAAIFLVSPADYAPAFELKGVAGQAMVQGVGLLFVMWCVPTCFALINPQKFRVSLLESILMQTIGLAGETILKALLPYGQAVLQTTVMRFIIFDAAGLVLLLLAGWFSRKNPKTVSA